jgi:hypothetical protein
MNKPTHSILGPSMTGLILGILVGLSPLAEADAISGKAVWTLGFGLAATYLSIGVLVGLLPALGPFAAANSKRGIGFLFGLVIGAAYSIPGGFFTMVPYPLDANAAEYWREFADGGWRAFFLTILFGAVVGGLCGLFRKKRAQ